MNVSAAQLFGPRFKVRYVFFQAQAVKLTAVLFRYTSAVLLRLCSAEHVRLQLISGVTMAAETISVLDSQEQVKPVPFAPEVQPELTQPGVPDLFNAPLETLEAVSEEAAAGKPPGEIAAETLAATVENTTDKKDSQEDKGSEKDSQDKENETENKDNTDKEKENAGNEDGIPTGDGGREAEQEIERLVGEFQKEVEDQMKDVPSHLENSDVMCKRCQRWINILETVERSPKERWRRSCNSLVTLLRRQMRWPPRTFASLPLEAQTTFFQQAAQLHKDNPRFAYQRVRDLLIRNLRRRNIERRTQSVGGTYKPISVHKQNGYNIPSDYDTRWPKEWSDSLQEWTYLISELTVNETQIQESVEEEIIQCEKQVKKRRNGTELEDGKKQKTEESTEALTGMDCIDLLSESDDEKSKPKGGKNLEAEAKKAAKKEEKKQLAEVKKAETKKKREIAVENKKLTALASKVVASLNQAFKTAHAFELEVIKAGKKPEDDEPQWLAFKEAKEDVEAAKTAAVEIMQKSAKGCTDPFPKIPFCTEKECNAQIKTLNSHLNSLKTLFKPAPKPKAAKAKKGQGKGEA